MAIERIINKNYANFKGSDKSVLVVGASWCPDCVGYHEILKYVANKTSEAGIDVRFGESIIDDRDPEMRTSDLKKDYKTNNNGENISTIPATILFRRGEFLHVHQGIQGNRELKKSLEKYFGIKFA